MSYGHMFLHLFFQGGHKKGVVSIFQETSGWQYSEINPPMPMYAEGYMCYLFTTHKL